MTTVEPLVTVIIPCYRQAHYLGEAVESVLAQRYTNFEIIVINDGSPDNTEEVVAQYSVRYIKQNNQGVSVARNTGICASRGKYLVFLDADDRLTPDALKIGVEYLNAHPEWAFVSGHHRYINSDGSLQRELPPESIGNNHYLALLQYNCIGMLATVMYQRSIFKAVGQFNPAFRSCEDYDLYLRITRRFLVGHHTYITAEYRRHQTNTTLNFNLLLKDTIVLFRTQWPYVQKQADYTWAYRSGLRAARHYFGYSLLNEIINTLKAGRLQTLGIRLISVPGYFILAIFTLGFEIRATAWLLLQRLKLLPQSFDWEIVSFSTWDNNQ